MKFTVFIKDFKMRYKTFSASKSGLTTYTTAYNNEKIEYMHIEYTDGFDFVDLRNKNLAVRCYDDESKISIGHNLAIFGKNIKYDFKFYIDKNFDIIKESEL